MESINLSIMYPSLISYIQLNRFYISISIFLWWRALSLMSHRVFIEIVSKHRHHMWMDSNEYQWIIFWLHGAGLEHICMNVEMKINKYAYSVYMYNKKKYVKLLWAINLMNDDYFWIIFSHSNEWTWMDHIKTITIKDYHVCCTIFNT